ncbi:FadR/GntR family transcriptional regulator [Cryptosporangium aurantiacum]|uniref:DNA-binding transcriptional regulator, FadR family n=1 Tax=Cryptosporangium aurantiacum TaxID=134849 RepID=A0A1M7R3Q8_9ACTN|nr:FCD domain-containing protein [Cryptosporangium aurantiacum]SHN39662.1 DNA-binding transcriptional regulator, FadR family [Cryptosporangium aurantiacum]
MGGPQRAKNRRPVKLAEQVAQAILQDIEKAGMAPGQRLPAEAVMAQAHGVSRGTLREALRILEVHGLITIKSGPGGGPVLAEMDHEDFARMATLHFQATGVTFRQLLEARIVLEPRMAELAAVNGSADQVSALRANLQAHGEARNVDDLMVHAHAFHSIVADMAGNNNKALSLMTSSLHGIFDIYQRRGRDLDVMRETVRVHERITDAIERRDSAKAALLMELHMEQSADTFARENPTLIDRAVSWLIS